MDEKKKQALTAALGQIEKQFGKGAVMILKRSHPVHWGWILPWALEDCQEVG